MTGPTAASSSRRRARRYRDACYRRRRDRLLVALEGPCGSTLVQAPSARSTTSSSTRSPVSASRRAGITDRRDRQPRPAVELSCGNRRERCASRSASTTYCAEASATTPQPAGRRPAAHGAPAHDRLGERGAAGYRTYSASPSCNGRRRARSDQRSRAGLAGRRRSRACGPTGLARGTLDAGDPQAQLPPAGGTGDPSTVGCRLRCRRAATRRRSPA